MTLPTDPWLSTQWHLGNTGGLFDLNVRAVWNPTTGRAYTGAGTRVVVIDDGFDYLHADIAPNYLVSGDYDFAENDLDPFGAATDSHGTAVAGLIGADNNGTGAVGVAFDTQLVGYRTAGQITDAWLQDIRDAIHHAAVSAHGDVANISQAISNDIESEFGLGYNAARFDEIETSIGEAVNQGRGGLGMTVVKAAGNQRAAGYDVNADDWSNDTRQVVVAAVDQNGFVSSYSSYGAAILVSAFGTPNEVITTDRTGAAGYNGSDFAFFSGTSAATPMVAGVVSLMYDANPSLGWRDVQSILANSARHVGSAVNGVSLAGSELNPWNWNNADTWNNGGLHFSNDYGYGLVDALAATRLAETWLVGRGAQTSSNEFTNTIDMLPTGTTMILGDGILAGQTLTGGAIFNDEIERVTVTVAFSTTWTADLELYITSPNGTTSKLIADQGGSSDYNGTWTFETQAFHGERAKGTWTVKLVDDAAGDDMHINDLVVRTYGAATVSDRYVYTNEFSNYAGIGGHATTLADANGGTDTINASAVSTGSVINLNAGATSIIDGVAMTIAAGTSIENAIGGDGVDTLTGNALSNLLYGGRASDVINGGAGTDTSIYTGARSNYDVVRLSTGQVQLADWGFMSPDGSDRVSNVESFQFTSGTKTLAQLVDITDFNLFQYNSNTHEVRDWIFTNGAISSNLSLGAPPANWKIIASGDFNMDGIGDAIWRDNSTGEVREWLLNGSGAITSNVSLGSLAASWRVVGTGDFNGDGQSDILWQNQATGDLRNWSMSNGVLANSTVLGSSGPEWRVVGTADVTGDGTYDILWRNTSNGEARMWQMSNGAFASQKAYGALPSNWGIAATGDFNHDGTGDVLWRDTSSGDMRLWQMSNGNIANNVMLGSVAPSWNVIGSGDYTQDGHDDLLWRNNSNGDTRLWDIVNNTITNNIVVGTTPAEWHAAVNPATHSDFLGLI